MPRKKKTATEDANVVVLKHRFQKWTTKVYFYDGQVDVVDGVVAIPREKRAWVQRAYIFGYRCDPNTGELLDLQELLASLDETADEVPVAEKPSAESAEEEPVEGLDVGGQSPDYDGVRASAEPSGGSVPSEGLGSGDGDGAAVRNEGPLTLADLEAVRPD